MLIYVINGPNLNMLGIREPELYGKKSYQALTEALEKLCNDENIRLQCFQSNHEGDLVDIIQSAYGKADGIVINPAAYTHTSIAIADALKAVNLPTIEVHLTDISAREPYRAISYTREACLAQITGEGFAGYEKAILLLKQIIEKKYRS